MVKMFIKGNTHYATITVSNLTQEQLNASEGLKVEVNESLLSGVNSNNLEDGEEVKWIFAKTE
jgi:hypothetical protein